MSKKNLVPAKKLKGFRDYTPELAIERRRIMDQVWSSALKAGFEPIDTPTLEYAETLLGTGGTDTDKEVYRFEDHGNRNVALRFDLTVPFARFVAEHQGTLILPFKKVQIGNVWRGEKPQKGRYREFAQADLDIVGVDSLAADVEVLSNMAENLEKLIPSNFTMALGHRVVLSALIQASLSGLDVKDENKILIAIDKLAKIGEEKVIEIMCEVEGVNAEDSKKLLTVLSSKDEKGHTDLSKVKDVLKDREEALAEVKRLEDTLSILADLVPSEKASIKLDLTIARGLGYYTGIVYETFIDALPKFGSVSSGGRYNGLVSRFTTKELPGIGGSIGVDRLLAALEALDATSEQKRNGVYVAVATEDARAYAFKILSQLRKANIRSDIALKPGKIGAQFKQADRRMYEKVITVGTNELEAQTFSVKTLETGDQKKDVSFSDLIKEI